MGRETEVADATALTYGAASAVEADRDVERVLIGGTFPAKDDLRPLLKRAFDVVFSVAFLGLVGVWLLPLIALAIKLDSPGPALFRQKRVGLGGRIFTCLKFRTMRTDAAAVFRQATKGDARVTRMGRFLRKTNLDELPQFINVLAGEMSIVGPRPHVQELDQKFSHEVRGYRRRHQVKPGITGLAQVLGYRGETRSLREMAHRVRLDTFYIRNIGLMVDLMIVARTVVVVLRGDDHAY